MNAFKVCSVMFMSATAGIIAATSVLAADFVVLAVTGTKLPYEPGNVLASGGRITLPAGARMTLMIKNGRLLKLKGPYNSTLTAVAGQSDKGRLIAVAKVFAGRRGSTTVGATRGVRATVGRPVLAGQIDPWVIEPARGGRACLRSGPLRLRRHSAKLAAEVAVWPPSGAPMRLEMKAGSKEITVSPIDVMAGTQLFYKVGKASKAVVISVLPTDTRADDHSTVLQWMAHEGCHYQARRLASRIHAK